MRHDKILFGAAYYEEYLPYDRMEEDLKMMAEAGFNTIRIAESTWSVEEPKPGCYDFSHVDRVIQGAARYELQVIVGTPTYAVPHWLVQLDPEVLAMTEAGQNRYGPRQNMDLTNPTYRRYAEGMIRALVAHTARCSNVIGYQIDNETKHYHTAGPQVVQQFRNWLREKFHGEIEAVNYAFGLRYWSNSVTSFEQLPDPRGTVNGSYGCAFGAFQRELAEDFLRWQGELVKEYKRPDQFITHNFDFEWRSFGPPGQQDGYSWGVQPDICHYEAAKAVTLAGTDIYCFSQDRLTGREIAFGGDLIRCLKRDNYLVLESQAQAFKDWLPYPGQLIQMAYSHLASGACGVMYWNWASLHNGIESYWKGLLSHDFASNPTYEETKKLGRELKRLSPQLSGLKKRNRIALVVSTQAVNALKWFPTDRDLSYNDVVLWMYGALYELNLECDILFPQVRDWSGYDLVVIPQLYCVGESLVEQVKSYVAQGGTVFATFRSFVADENLKIYHDAQPHGLTECFGMTYNQYTRPVRVTVKGALAQYWMELLTPTTAQTVAPYQHKYWGRYAAVTRNDYGKGHAWYLGTMLPEAELKSCLLRAAADAGITPLGQQFPVILRSGTAEDGSEIRFLFHYASEPCFIISQWNGVDLRSGKRYIPGDSILLKDWDVCILKEDGKQPH